MESPSNRSIRILEALYRYVTRGCPGVRLDREGRVLCRHGDPITADSIRCVGRIESEDFVHWTEPELMIAPSDWTTAGDSYYGLTVLPYAGAYLGLLQVFHRQAPNCGYLEEQLVISDDARRWRPAGDSMFLTAGEPGAWDCGSVGAGPRVVVRDQDLLFYYSGTPRSHGGGTPPPLPEDGLGLAILRRDGFACLWPPWHEGLLTTHPGASSGQTLQVNTDAARGQVSAAVLDSSSGPLPGYAHDDCIPVHADSTGALLRWQQHAALPFGQEVRIEFRVREASLYSFAFAQPE